MAKSDEDLVGLSLRIRSSLKRQLTKMARADDRSLSQYLRKILAEHVAVKGVK